MYWSEGIGQFPRLCINLSIPLGHYEMYLKQQRMEGKRVEQRFQLIPPLARGRF